MVEKNPVTASTAQDEQYKGPSNTIVTLGYGSGYGWVYKGAGVILGGAAAIFSTSGSNTWIARGTKQLETIKNWVTGRGGLVMGGALLGSMIGHYVGLAIGLKHGSQHAGDGRAQYERIKAERNDARQEVAELRQALKHSRSELAALASEAPRNEISGPAEVLAATRQVSPSTEIAR